ncbi:MAG TPA: tetratricopeptide repeat protein [Mycobacteriales bacterium]|nr:tetratricopeptide repeat protein [Mycobacteriales bacterium]
MHTGSAADRLLDPHRDRTPVPLTAPAAGVGVEPLETPAQALAWLAAEHAVVLAAIGLASRLGRATAVWQLAEATDAYLDRLGHWNDLAIVWQAALAVADRLDQPGATEDAHRNLAHAYLRLGRFAAAHAQHQQALGGYVRAGDHLGQARTHHSLTVLFGQQGRLDEALAHGQQALAGFRAAGHERGQAVLLNEIGWCHALRGDHHAALGYCQQALDLLDRLGDRLGAAHAADSLGYIHHQLGQRAAAVTCYEYALDRFREASDRYHEADALSRLGDGQLAAEPAAARAAWLRAVDLLTELEHPDADAVRAKLDATQPGNPAGPP